MDSLAGWRRTSVAGYDAVEVACPDWQGEPWRHTAVRLGPEGGEGVLYLTGGPPHPVDLAWASGLASRAGTPVVACFEVPNQPRFGLTEDRLVAHTFDRYLETGDPEWPLLVPMARGAQAAMRAATEAWGVGRWVVTGASKRGWTAWLAGLAAGGKVAGIAPLAFDNLGMMRQVARQERLWGGPSPMYEPYLELDLVRRCSGEAGAGLLKIVDPGESLDRLGCAVLLMTGTNDPFWLLDASDEYWPGLRGLGVPCFRPNLGHALPSGPSEIGTLARFVRSCFGGAPLPRPELALEGGRTAHVRGARGRPAWIWTAASDSPWWVESRWRPQPVGDGVAELPPEFAEAPYAAALLEVFGDGPEGPWSATSRPCLTGPGLDTRP